MFEVASFERAKLLERLATDALGVDVRAIRSGVDPARSKTFVAIQFVQPVELRQVVTVAVGDATLV